MSEFTAILEEMYDIHKAKNNDYSPEGEFGNFSESERVGVEAWKGAFIRLQDKYTRCCNLVRGKEAMVKDEALEDTLLDLANYSVIVLCLRRSAKQKQDNESVSETNFVDSFVNNIMPCQERKAIFHHKKPSSLNKSYLGKVDDTNTEEDLK